MVEIQSIENEAYTQKRKQQEIEQLRDMYTQTFTSENGKKVLNDLANRCHAMPAMRKASNLSYYRVDR